MSFFCLFFILAPAPLKNVSERETKFVSARDNFVAPPQKMSRTETIRANLSRTETIRANLSRTETILLEDPGGGDNSILEALKASGIETKKRQKKDNLNTFITIIKVGKIASQRKLDLPAHGLKFQTP